NPGQEIYLYFALPIKGYIFGIIYLAYSHWMSKKENDNINHDAHFIGAVYGLVFPVILNPGVLNNFLNQIFG
ncbi:MAG: rhomboid family intramembrane serine protease, partial [bacterium]